MSNAVEDLVSELKSVPGLRCPAIPAKVFATELVENGYTTLAEIKTDFSRESVLALFDAACTKLETKESGVVPAWWRPAMVDALSTLYPKTGTVAAEADDAAAKVKRMSMAATMPGYESGDDGESVVEGGFTFMPRKGSVAGARTLMKLVKENGMTPSQATAYDCALFSGFPVMADEVAGTTLGQDVKTTPYAAKCKKADIHNMQKVLASSDPTEYDDHIANLIERLTCAEMTLEVTLTSRFYQATNEVFSDKKARNAYVRQYHAANPGIGYLKTMDLRLMIKQVATMKSSAGEVSKAQFDSLKAALDTSKNKVTELSNQMTNLTRTVNQLRNDLAETNGTTAPPIGGRGKGGLRNGDKTPACGNCGQVGHFARNCPNKPPPEDQE
tara:strand:- start:107 stop:1264 length:1158 start_codon:yes stop_codon:yes gene_type:complete